MIELKKKYTQHSKGTAHEIVISGFKKEIEILREIIESKNREIKLLKMELKEGKMETQLGIVSGAESTEFWKGINEIDHRATHGAIHNVLYSIGCKMQELESEIEKNRDLIKQVERG